MKIVSQIDQFIINSYVIYIIFISNSNNHKYLMSIYSNCPNDENSFIQNIKNDHYQILKITDHKKLCLFKEKQKTIKNKNKNFEAIKIVQNYSAQENTTQYDQSSILISDKLQQVKFSQKQNLLKQNLKESFNNYYFQEIKRKEDKKQSKILQKDNLNPFFSKQLPISSQSHQIHSLALNFQKYLHQFQDIFQKQSRVKRQQKKIDLIDSLIQTMTKNKKKKLQQLFNQRVQISKQRHQEKQFLKQKLKEVQRLKYEQTFMQDKKNSNRQQLLSLQSKLKNFDFAINSEFKKQNQ